MKVNNNKDSVELSHLSRKKTDKAGAAKQKDLADVAGPVNSSGAGEAAGVSISSEAKAMSAANQIAKAENPDQAKIDRVKAMINSGTYKPDFGKVAENMINEAVLEAN